jgi:hypothetical protein
VDIIGLLNDLTGNNLLLWKVVGATVVFALAGSQVLFAARGWGASPFPPVPNKTAWAVHRFQGRLALTLAVVIAVACIAGPAGPTSPTRVLLHSIFGSLALLIIAAKLLVLHVLKGRGRWLPWLGTSLFLAFGAIWATSVADYVTAR